MAAGSRRAAYDNLNGGNGSKLSGLVRSIETGRVAGGQRVEADFSSLRQFIDEIES